MAQNNKIAVRIAQYFFNATHKRATAATMKQTIGQAKSLLNAGFTPEEIIIVINELVEHPPKNGFRSLGFLSYVMEDVLTKYKAKEVKRNFETTIEPLSLNLIRRSEYEIKNTSERIGNEFDTNLF